MTSFQIVALYVALNLLLKAVLMVRVGQSRTRNKVNLGDGGNEELFGRIRAHGNFIETTPLALLGLFALAMLNAPALALHIFGAGFFLGRVAHAIGMAAPQSTGKGRLIGAVLALLTFIAEAVYLLYLIIAGAA